MDTLYYVIIESRLNRKITRLFEAIEAVFVLQLSNHGAGPLVLHPCLDQIYGVDRGGSDRWGSEQELQHKYTYTKL